MPDPMSRRDAIRQLGVAGAGAVLGGAILRGQDADFIVAGQPVEIVVSSVSAVTARITIRAKTGGSDAALADGALIKPEWGAPLARWNVSRAAFVRLGTGPGSFVRVSEAPLKIEILEGGGRGAAPAANAAVWQSLQFEKDTGVMTFEPGDGLLLGFGEGGHQFDRKQRTDRMRSGQVSDPQSGYAMARQGGRVPIQWLMSTAKGGGIYIHQPLGVFDFTGPKPKFTAPAIAPLPFDIFVVASSDPAVLMKSYAEITGFPELPPLWSFGYLQSHRTLDGAKEVQWVADTMREKKLPCDGLIYLGTEFTPSGWNTPRNGEFAWHPTNFPEPKKQIDALHAQHFKVILHVVIEGQRLTGTVADACTAPEPSGRPPDQNQWPPDRTAGCYWPHHKSVFDLGIDGWWPDQGDGYTPASKLARIRMYFEGQQVWKPNARVFALHRNGYAGMQRYAAFLWSGDVQSMWETLRNHVPVAINCGLSGIPYWGTDIGGFIPTPDYTGELHVRWFQFGAFNTLFRAHGRDWHLRLPWGWNTGEPGPVETNYAPPPEQLHNADVEPICRKFLELRYRLMPYLYTAVRDGHDTGLPVVRALWLHDPSDQAGAARGDQYLWGRDMLVAPVVEKGATSRKLYVPRGKWIDFWTEAVTEGGREIDRAVTLDMLPLYVRAGAIIPMGPVKQYVEQPSDEPLTLTVYPGADGTASVYEDDGTSFDFRKGASMRIAMTWRDATKQLALSLAPGSRMLPPARRPITVRLAGTQTTKSVTFSGQPVTVQL